MPKVKKGEGANSAEFLSCGSLYAAWGALLLDLVFWGKIWFFVVGF
ncbi:hypothetical protein [Campylobacter lanienae]|nr:hypothetical protein [Campylobacter lanienae]